MKTFIFFAFIAEILIFNFSASSQNDCPNADFSFQDFTNWQGYTGTYTACCITPGIVPGRHTIIDSIGNDPNTGNLLSVLPPGLNVSARLGNQNVGAEAERLRYELIVDSSNAIFFYRYAVVLEDPSHAPSEQPKFDIKITASSTVGLCGEYHVVSGGSIPGFQAYGGVRWKDWTTVGIDLTPFIGDTVSIEYTTYDCFQSGHYGYAYISCGCMENKINVNYTPNYEQATLTVPTGFSYLWSSGGTDTLQSITVNNPVSGSVYTCTLTSVTGCSFTLSATLLIPTETQVVLSDISNIYPNPTERISYIKLPEVNSNITYSYNLYGMNNQIILKNKGTGNEIEINSSNIASGNYIIIIQTSTNHKYKAKIIVN